MHFAAQVPCLATAAATAAAQARQQLQQHLHSSGVSTLLHGDQQL
jgi:hypothetical protein